MTTKIEWAEETWNPITGCTKISAGCRNCYAERMAKRLANIEGSGYDKSNPFGVKFHPDRLDQLLHWKKPRKVFVCSMGDLFHEDVMYEWIYQIFAIMQLCPQHTFMVLTKRPKRMALWFAHYSNGGFSTMEIVNNRANKIQGFAPPNPPKNGWVWPLPNIWLGVTAENQQAADERIPWLLKTPAAKRFVSVEPMLGPVDLDIINGALSTWWQNSAIDCVDTGHLDWVICGGETGPGARPMHPDWARSLRDQCQSAGVPFFFKKWGEYSPNVTVFQDGVWQYDPVKVGKKRAGRLLDGKLWEEWPEDGE